jgi:hypothetical protein
MSDYVKHTVEKFHKQYIERTFDQDDVSLFLILTRDYAQKGTILRELGDFIAHPKEKDQGIVIKSFLDIIKDFDENTRKFFQPDRYLISSESRGLGGINDVQISLSKVFDLFGLKIDKENGNDLSLRDFVFCIIFMLSSFKLKIHGKLHDMLVEYGHSVSLSINYESQSVEKHFIVLNVLFLPNVNIESIYSNLRERPINYIARRFDVGILAAIPYENDYGDKIKRSEDFPRGTAYPLRNYR